MSTSGRAQRRDAEQANDGQQHAALTIVAMYAVTGTLAPS